MIGFMVNDMLLKKLVLSNDCYQEIVNHGRYAETV